MPALNRRSLIVISVATVLLLFIGFGIGRLTAGTAPSNAVAADTTVAGSIDTASQSNAEQGSTESSSEGSQDDPAGEPQSPIEGDAAAALVPTLETPDGGIPIYGTAAEREAFLAGMEEAGLEGGTPEGLLKTADRVCYDLERLQAQNRSPAFAVRVVWNETLAELDSRDLAAFSVVFNSAPYYLCVESIEYGTEVAYWLGY